MLGILMALILTLETFITQVSNGQSDVLVGVYVPGVVAQPVQRQPNGDWLYVSDDPEIVNEYLQTTGRSVGLLAHNYLAGRYFEQIQAGDDLYLIYGDGRTRRYRVAKRTVFQRIGNTFVNRKTFRRYEQNQFLDAFFRRYDQVALLTCVKKGKDWSWGVLVITALPYESIDLSVGYYQWQTGRESYVY